MLTENSSANSAYNSYTHAILLLGTTSFLTLSAVFFNQKKIYLLKSFENYIYVKFLTFWNFSLEISPLFGNTYIFEMASSTKNFE